jgi:CPA1 family monovalent cation:H+ antiporter
VALALPTKTATGRPFPDRDLIVFVAFGVIFTTLVLPGLTLPALIRRLGLRDTGAEEREEARARLATTDAALRRLEELAAEDWPPEDTVERLQHLFRSRRRRLKAEAGIISESELEDHPDTYRQLISQLIEAQRRAVAELRNQGAISSGVLHRVERDLDLEESRLEI